MKKNVLKSAVLMMLCLVLIMGCGNSYGDKVFTCSSKNMMGFEGVYVSGSTVTIHFVTKNASTEAPKIDIGRVLSPRSGDKFYLVTKGADFIVIDTKELTIDSLDGTISFTLTGYSTDDLQSIHFVSENYSYSIDIVKAEIEALIEEGDAADLCMQSYDSSKWSEVVSLSGLAK
ncbi:MAG: hypothetical protein J6V94_03450 [Lachnospiraceae bacterium]|nr:hypothetical protein [Lachnospiraceae bacterium]